MNPDGEERMENEAEREIHEKATKRVDARIGFYTHLGVYLLVNAILVVVNLSTQPDELWFQWPLLGWGIGLFFHGVGVFGFGEGTGRRERMIEREVERERRRRGRGG